MKPVSPNKLSAEDLEKLRDLDRRLSEVIRTKLVIYQDKEVAALLKESFEFQAYLEKTYD